MEEVCRKCGTTLLVGETWSVGLKNHGERICIMCNRERYRNWYKTKLKTDPKFREKRNRQFGNRIKERMKEEPEFRKKHNLYKNEYNKRRYAEDPEFRERLKQYNRERYNKNKQKRAVYRIKSISCKILKEHAEQLKEDPERLSTDFLKKLLRINKESCKGVDE